MKYVPKPLEGNVNVSHTHPLWELGVLCGGMLLIVLGLYVAAGLAVDLVAPYVSPELERSIGGSMVAQLREGHEDDPRNAVLTQLTNELNAASPDPIEVVEVFIMDAEMVNAFALPGGTIMVTSGLMGEVGSENELAAVLAHELGHVAHRDVLRGMGRGLVMAVASALVMGSDWSADTFAGSALHLSNLRFSRAQEEAADTFALQTLVGHYGHAAGAVEFFERVREKWESSGSPPEFFSTHPDTGNRIKRLAGLIEDSGYPVLEPRALDEGLLVEPEVEEDLPSE